MHPLDLPFVGATTSESDFCRVLDVLQVGTRQHGDTSLDQGSMQWLTTIVASELGWLPGDTANVIRERAARRLSQACGVAARSNFTREVEVPPFVLQLYEPGLTEDNIGAITWGSSLLLSKRIAKNKSLLKGRVLELGSGTGLCGLTAAKLGSEVLLTDLPEIIPNLKHNIELNRCNADVMCLDWRLPHTANAETILIADPVYTPEQPGWLVNAIRGVENAQNILLQFPLRPTYEKERQAVYDGLNALGFREAEYEEEHGYDDYGEMDYAFSLWIL